jgi:hypothetical protein
MRNAYKIFVGKPKGKRPLEGPGHINVNNIWAGERGQDASDSG